MEIVDHLYKQMKCCLSEDEHMVIEPLKMPCGGNICKDCRKKPNILETMCNYCNEYHIEYEFDDLKSNIGLKHLMEKVFLENIIKKLQIKIKDASESLKSKLN